MRNLTFTLLASAALAMPAMVPAMALSNAKPQAQANQQNGQQNQKQAANQHISARRLGRSGVRQVQRALDKDGFHAGRADGIYGRETRSALNDFQKSKGIQSNGQINRQTLSVLGVKVSNNGQNSMSNPNGNNNPEPQSSSQNTNSPAAQGQITRNGKSAKRSVTSPSFTVGKLTVQGRPNGMVAMLNQDEDQDTQLK